MEPTAVVAVVCGNGKADREIGLAAFDPDGPLLALSQFVDGLSFEKTIGLLHILNPREMLVPNTVGGGLSGGGGFGGGGRMSRLCGLVTSLFPAVKVTRVQRVFFNADRGRDYVARLRIPRCAPVEVQVRGEIEKKFENDDGPLS